MGHVLTLWLGRPLAGAHGLADILLWPGAALAVIFRGLHGVSVRPGQGARLLAESAAERPSAGARIAGRRGGVAARRGVR